MLKNLLLFLKDIKEIVTGPQPVKALSPSPPPLVSPPKPADDPLLDSAPTDPEPALAPEPKVVSEKGFCPECMYCHRDTVFQVSGRDVATNGAPISFGNWVCPQCFATMTLVTYGISSDGGKTSRYSNMVFWNNAQEHKATQERERKLAEMLSKDKQYLKEKDALKGMKS